MKKIFFIGLLITSTFVSATPVVQTQEIESPEDLFKEVPLSEMKHKMQLILDYKRGNVEDMQKCLDEAKTKKELFNCKPTRDFPKEALPNVPE